MCVETQEAYNQYQRSLNIVSRADCQPVNTKHLRNICTMLDQRQRRWAGVVQMLCKCFVFAGLQSICTLHTSTVYPSKHGTLNQCYFNGGATAQTVRQP